MSNFTPSNLVAAQTKLTDAFAQNEMREKVLPALKMGLTRPEVLIPSAEEVRKREDRTVTAYVLKRSSRAAGSSRTYNHSGSRGDSFSQGLTWTTYSDVFSLSKKQLDNNVFGYSEALAQQLKNSVLNLHASIESDVVTNLHTNRTQVAVTNIDGRAVLNNTNYAYKIQGVDAKQFYQIAKTVRRQNKYNKGLDVIASPATYIDAEFWASQGQGNKENTGFQFTGLNIAESIELSDSNYGKGISLVMPTDAFKLLQWIPPINREGYGDFESYTGGYSTFKDPMGSGLTFAIHVYGLRNDTSGSNGSQQDNELQFELSIDIANVLSPLSTSNETVIYQFGQLA